MNKVVSVINFKNFIDLNKRVKTGLGLILISLIVNHIAQKESFFLGSTYDFPLLSTLISIVISTSVLIIADYNFKYFKERYFKEKITPQLLIQFLLSTLGYVSIVYIPIYLVYIWLEGGKYQFYYFLSGLSITLLLSSLGIIFIYAKDIYQLHKLEVIGGKISFKKNGNTYLIDYSDIVYIYSEFKIVNIVTRYGKKIATDFTLNEVEDTISNHLFFRANRQTIINLKSVESSQSIENGKLLVTLKAYLSDKEKHQFIISRYKKKAYQEWLAKML